MAKTLDTISEVISNPKHPFHQVDSQPDKAHKHRYERRKAREYMRQADWNSDRSDDEVMH
jgi:hypothetical protein